MMLHLTNSYPYPLNARRSDAPQSTFEYRLNLTPPVLKENSTLIFQTLRALFSMLIRSKEYYRSVIVVT